MKTAKTSLKNIDEYIGGFPVEVQEILQKVRETIHRAAPKAEETISYNMPTFNLNGHYLIYFAGYKHHISLYRSPRISGGDRTLRVGQGHAQIPAGQTHSLRADPQGCETQDQGKRGRAPSAQKEIKYL